jgi:glycosyltransferase involved in cell wall biosynthesis
MSLPVFRPRVLTTRPRPAAAEDPVGELRRSLDVLRALHDLEPDALVRGTPPAPGPELVTVVVPMWNAARFIELCLKGLLAQTHAELEIFCVDDHSDDDTYDRVVATFGDDARLCVVRLAARVGPYQIKNWVVSRLARGRFIALQDADDVSHPWRIALQSERMLATGTPITGASIHLFYPPTLAPRFETAPCLMIPGSPWIHSRGLYDDVAAVPGPSAFPDVLGPTRPFFIARHGTQMFTRDVLLRFGGFDGRTRFGADTEFDWRALRFVRLVNLPEILYSRRLHGYSLTNDPETGYDSAPRRAYGATRDARQRAIVSALAAGDRDLARRLCTEDLHHADVEVEQVHGGFPLAPNARESVG